MVSENEKKFWGCPKLMENLLPFLDTHSTICLAKVNTLSKIPNKLSLVPNTRSQISKTLMNTKNTISKEYHIQYFLANYFTICLAQAYKPALDLVLVPTVWHKLITRVCNWKRGTRASNSEKEFQQMRIQVTYILLFCKYDGNILQQHVSSRAPLSRNLQESLVLSQLILIRRDYK